MLMKYPDNWKKYGEKENISFAPDGGVMEGSDGRGALAYGVIVDVTKRREMPATRKRSNARRKI